MACALQVHGEWVIGQFRISAEGHLLNVLLKSVTTFATATLASAAFQASSINIFLLPGCISCAPHHSPVQISSCNDQRLLPFLLHKFLKCYAQLPLASTLATSWRINFCQLQLYIFTRILDKICSLNSILMSPLALHSVGGGGGGDQKNENSQMGAHTMNL